MVLVVVFGVALLVAVLLSGLAARTVLSTSFLFLAGGALVSDGFLGLIHIMPDSEMVSATADLALFAVLFTDGMHVSLPKLRANWKNPARALGLGLPLAFVFMALVTHFLVGLDWTTSFLVGAVLAPVPRDPMKVVCTGDWVAVDPEGGDPRYVRTVLPRRTAFVRSTSSKRSEGQVLATNIDHVVICVSLAVELDLGRIERFLALAMSGSGGEAPLHTSALSWESGATTQRWV